MAGPVDYIYISLQLSLGEEGRRNAMTRIWELYGNKIYFYISRSLPGHGSGWDDCYQETMIKIYNGLKGFSAGRPLRPWLYRIAHNCCLDQLNRRTDESIDDVDPMQAADCTGQEEHLLRRELGDTIERAVAGLAAEDSRIAYLRFYEGMKFRHIAGIMRMNEKTVKTRITAIKRRLQSELRGWL
jgi:RNA polymerase sigma-70 factor (ECF subfamily)